MSDKEPTMMQKILATIGIGVTLTGGVKATTEIPIPQETPPISVPGEFDPSDPGDWNDLGEGVGVIIDGIGKKKDDGDDDNEENEKGAGLGDVNNPPEPVENNNNTAEHSDASEAGGYFENRDKYAEGNGTGAEWTAEGTARITGYGDAYYKAEQMKSERERTNDSSEDSNSIEKLPYTQDQIEEHGEGREMDDATLEQLEEKKREVDAFLKRQEEKEVEEEQTAEEAKKQAEAEAE